MKILKKTLQNYALWFKITCIDVSFPQSVYLYVQHYWHTNTCTFPQTYFLFITDIILPNQPFQKHLNNLHCLQKYSVLLYTSKFSPEKNSQRYFNIFRSYLGGKIPFRTFRFCIWKIY